MNKSDVILDSLLMHNSFLPINIQLGKNIGLYETAFLSFLFYHKNQLKFKNLDYEFVPLPFKEIMEQCPFFNCEKTLQRLIEKLINLGLIVTERRGSPPITHFKVCRDSIANMIISESPYKDDLPKENEKSKFDKNIVQYAINRYQSLARRGAFPVLMKVTPSRTSQVVTRVKEYPDKEYWKKLFDKLEKDKFLWRSNNSELSWLTFDFIFRKGCADKILDGKYNFISKDYVDMSSEDNNPELIFIKNDLQNSLKYYRNILSMEKLQKNYKTPNDRIDGLFEIALTAELLAYFQEDKSFNYGVSNYMVGENFHSVFSNFVNSEFKKLEILTPRMILESIVPFLKHIEHHGGNMLGDTNWEKYVWSRINS